jgi:hypothetical protein
MEEFLVRRGQTLFENDQKLYKNKEVLSTRGSAAFLFFSVFCSDLLKKTRKTVEPSQEVPSLTPAAIYNLV